MQSLVQDIRYAWRLLAKSPGFAAVAILTLALGIGANTAIFGVLNSVLLRPLPFPSPEQLVRLWESHPEDGIQDWVAPANFVDWRAQSKGFVDMAAFASGSAALAGRDEPEQVSVAHVSVSLLRLLGVRPLRGRVFLEEEGQPGHDLVVLISEGLWKRRFGADQNLLGETVSLDGENYRVVGILPQGFEFPERVEIWIPLALTPNQTTNRSAHFLDVVARLKPEVTWEQAQAEMSTIAHQLQQQYPETNARWSVKVVTFHEHLVGKVKPALRILLGAVGFVLLIACANVANLLLARAVERQKEIAIRTALGAGPGRIIRQLLTESLLLALTAGVVGSLMAVWGLDLLLSVDPASLPRLQEMRMDARVLGFTMIVSLASTLIFGLVPALRSCKPDLNEGLKEGGRTGTVSSRWKGIPSLFVVAQVSLSLVLMVGTGLLIKSFLRLSAVDPGFASRNLLTFGIDLPASRYQESPQVVSFYQRFFDRLETIPGIQSAGGVTMLPLGEDNRVFSFRHEAQAVLPPAQRSSANFRIATTHYFRTMGIRLLRGRVFSDEDKEGAPPVLIINDAMARRFWPTVDPVGKRIIVRNEQVAREIVGVVGDVKHFGLDIEAGPEMYVPHLQWPARSMMLVVRTSEDPASLAPAIRIATLEVDKQQPLYAVRTGEELITRNLARRRFTMLLFGMFGAVALLLAAAGTYSVIAHTVAQRTHEIGIRMALGARCTDVLKLVLGRGLRLIALGSAIGLLGAVVATRALRSLLFEVRPTDPWTFAGVAIVLLLVALAACYVPARRATRVDPIVALRYE